MSLATSHENETHRHACVSSPLAFSCPGPESLLGLNQDWGLAKEYEGGQGVKGLFKAEVVMKEQESKLRKERNEGQ